MRSHKAYLESLPQNVYVTYLEGWTYTRRFYQRHGYISEWMMDILRAEHRGYVLEMGVEDAGRCYELHQTVPPNPFVLPLFIEHSDKQCPRV